MRPLRPSTVLRDHEKEADMTKPAVIAGMYTNVAYLNKIGVARITIEVPRDIWDANRDVLGDPPTFDGAKKFVAITGLTEDGFKKWASQIPTAEPSRVSGDTENGPASASELTTHTTQLEHHAEKPKSQDKARKSRSQIAALKIREWVFREWMEYSGLFPGWAPNRLQDDPDDRLQVSTADAALKDILGIKSKAELDVPGPAQDKWDKLLASYDFKDQVRA